MTPERLRELIAAGETLDVEFKGERSGALGDNDLIEAGVCMANRPGTSPGWILLGVEDDGTVTGARRRHGVDTDPLRVQALIANNTIPSLSCRAEVVPLGSAQVLMLEVPAATTAVGTRSGIYKRRAIGGRGTPECVPFHFHEMQARMADRGGARAARWLVETGLLESRGECKVARRMAREGKLARVSEKKGASYVRATS